jgi:hypothetical protein
MNEFIPNFDDIYNTANLSKVITFSCILITCIVSASLSASIAEKKLHGTFMHLLLGGALPLAYPLIISVALPSRLKKTNTAPSKDKTLSEEDDIELPFQDLDAAYFKKIYIDSDGNFTGPFMIESEDSVIKAEAIVDVQTDFVVVETITKSGSRQRLRVPYDKMTSCTEA